jgi:hypothetical protein
VILVGSLLLSALVATPSAAPRTALLPLSTSGQVDLDEVSRVEAALRAAAQQSGALALVSREDTARQLSAARDMGLSCAGPDDVACWGKVGIISEFARIVVPTLEDSAGQARVLRVLVIDVEAGRQAGVAEARFSPGELDAAARDVITRALAGGTLSPPVDQERPAVEERAPAPQATTADAAPAADAPGDGFDALLWVGAGGAALGALTAVTGVGGALFFESQFWDTTLSSADREAAKPGARVLWGVAIAGGVVGLSAGALAAVSVIE